MAVLRGHGGAGALSGSSGPAGGPAVPEGNPGPPAGPLGGLRRRRENLISRNNLTVGKVFPYLWTKSLWIGGGKCLQPLIHVLWIAPLRSIHGGVLFPQGLQSLYVRGTEKKKVLYLWV